MAIDLNQNTESVTMQKAGRILQIGRNKLFQFLRDKDVLDYDNTPYQSFIDRGYFEITTKEIPRNRHRNKLQLVTLVTPKGLKYIEKLLKEDRGNSSIRITIDLN